MGSTQYTSQTMAMSESDNFKAGILYKDKYFTSVQIVISACDTMPLMKSAVRLLHKKKKILACCCRTTSADADARHCCQRSLATLCCLPHLQSLGLS